jgi:chorismate mutase
VNYLEDPGEEELMRRVEALIKEGRVDRETAEAVVDRLIKALNEAKAGGRSAITQI